MLFICRYDFLSRPLNLFPLDRDVINTEFLIVTREERYKLTFSVKTDESNQIYFRSHQKLKFKNKRQLKSASFRKNRQTKIIIHGFLDHGDVDWIKVIL